MAKNTKTAKKVTETKVVMGSTDTKVTVTRTVMGKDVSTDTKEDKLVVNQFVTEPAKVSLTMGVTINLGNFEGARVDVGVTLPCYAEEVEAAHSFASSWVETKIVREIEALRDHTRKRTTPTGSLDLDR